LRRPNFTNAIYRVRISLTLTAITKGKRGITTSLALKIEKKLGFDEGFLIMLQEYLEIEVEKKKQIKNTPKLKLIRPVLFWDSKFENIDWIKQKKAVMKRVLNLVMRMKKTRSNDIIAKLL
jgi:hypothetical protein